MIHSAPRRLFAMAVAAAALLIPSEAFACWYTCTSTYGFRRMVDGEEYTLQYCTETWPEGATRPHTTCYYS